MRPDSGRDGRPDTRAPAIGPPDAAPTELRSVPTGPIVIGVCVSCRGADPEASDRPGRRLLDTLLAARDPALGIEIRAVQCMSVCSRVCTASLSAPGRYTYVFGDIDPETGAASLLAGAATFAAAEHGYMLWRERPEALRRGIVARIPPTTWDGEDGAHPR